MLLLGGIAVLALSTLGSTKRLDPRQQDIKLNGTTPSARSYIVEYIPGFAGARISSSDESDIVVVKNFESRIFSGASIQSNTHNMDSLQRLEGVLRVWPNKIISLDPLGPVSFSDEAAASNYTTYNTTGVSKLHERGIYGQGVKIGVVDTGIWYHHAALGGGYGPGFKIAGGYDFVGDGFWPSEPKRPDDDPLDLWGHGTHVAGIIAGENEHWTGVAPRASIYSYKVFSQSLMSDDATLIEAFLKAHEDGVDIITASIGDSGGWSTNPWAEVASRLVEEGVIVTIAAGNSGALGPFFASSGSSGKNVLAIASVEAEKYPASPFELTFSLDGTRNITKAGYLPSGWYFPSSVAGWPVVPLNFDTSAPADGCEPYPEGTPSLTGKVALVRRGTCKIETKQKNLLGIGAEYVLVYNNEEPLVTLGGISVKGRVGLITTNAGKAVIDIIKAGGNVTADFSPNPEAVVGLESSTGSRPSTFTSWGGTNDLQIKPDIAAPGERIFSTYLGGTYALLSGTSMATPFVAGVAALYISAHGGRATHGKGFAKRLHQRIIFSGTALPWSDGTAKDYGFSAPVPQVGNGLINAFKVINYTTELDFEKFALNDTHYFRRYHDLTVTNHDSKDITYKLSYDAAAGVEAAGWFELSPTSGEKRLKSFAELIPISLPVQVSLPGEFTLKPGKSKSISVIFKKPDNLGWNSSALPLYSGKVFVSASNGEQLSVPYSGLAANLKAESNPIYRTTYPFSTSTRRRISIQDKSNYTFDLSKNEQDFPKIYSKIMWGTKEVRWDIYEAGWSERNWEYPPVPGRNGYIGPATSWVGNGRFSWVDLKYDDPDDTWTYPRVDLFRSTQIETSFHEFWWFGKLGNGSQIELGTYTMRFATLRPFGNPKSADNWDVFKTPQIKVLGKYNKTG